MNDGLTLLNLPYLFQRIHGGIVHGSFVVGTDLYVDVGPIAGARLRREWYPNIALPLFELDHFVGSSYGACGGTLLKRLTLLAYGSAKVKDPLYAWPSFLNTLCLL